MFFTRWRLKMAVATSNDHNQGRTEGGTRGTCHSHVEKKLGGGVG